MASKKAAKKKKGSKKAPKKKPGGKKSTIAASHGVKITNGKPAPPHLTGVSTGDTVAFTKHDHADRYADFAESPFQAGGGHQKFKIPKTLTVVAAPTKPKSYPYDVLDKDGNILSKKGPPNPPDVVVGS